MKRARSRLGLWLVLGVLAALLPVGAVAPALATVPPHISELHYDNAGADVGEFVEVTGDAGINLAGWSIELYNGSSTQLNVYGTINLAGVIDDEGTGIGALSFARAGIQNGSPDGLALVNSVGTVVEFLSYEGTFTPGAGYATGTPSIDMGVSEPSSTPIGLSLQLLAGVWTGPAAESPGDVNSEPPPPAPTLIHDVQGNGAISPLSGQAVSIEGIVVGDFQDGAAGTHGDLNGFFVQEEDADADTDPTTSEGIFVYDGSSPAVDASVGDLVRVTGTVSEYVTSSGASSETQLGSLSSVDITSGRNPLPTVSQLALPYAAVTDLESYEGMSVVFGSTQNVYIAEYFNYDRFNEVVLTVDPRPAQPTAVFEPGSIEASDLADLNARSRITLDDGRTSQNPTQARHPDGSNFTVDNSFRGGDQLNNVSGALSETHGLYRIQPTAGATYTPLNERTAVPDEVGGTLQVASFNVLNYFTTVDDGSSNCGPLENQGCRGADNLDELERQRTKIVQAIAAIDADIVGLIEIENHVATSVDEPLDDLVQGINAVAGAGTYDYVTTGPIGSDAIKVALVYKPATVALNGAYEILDSSVDPLFDDGRNRPALAQTFTELSTGESATVVVNHLKSKGSSCGAGDDDPEQGSCNLTRTNAATAIVNWLDNPANAFDEDVLVIGDLNAYDKEDPIDALTAGGYSDLTLEFLGEYAYTYGYSGQWGYLDYAMANSSLQSAVTATTVWHINADEPDILDYDTNYNDPSFYAPDAYRSSDHDPVIVGLDLARPQFDKAAARDVLAVLLPVSDKNTTKRIEKAIDGIETSLGADWWIDDQTISSKKVFDNERRAVVQLGLVVADGVAEAAAAQSVINVLVNADRQLARIAIISAANAGGDPARLSGAEAAMAEAAAYVDAGLYDEAVNAYKRAWDKATRA
jgi:predicted extracellular nuclease